MSNLSVDELLRIVKSDVEPIKNKKTHDHVLSFVKECKIDTGDIRIPASYIFYYYKKKWHPTSKNKLKKIAFFREFSNLFSQYRTSNYRYYLLNTDLGITFEEFELAKKFNKHSDCIFKARNRNEKKEKN